MDHRLAGELADAAEGKGSAVKKKKTSIEWLKLIKPFHISVFNSIIIGFYMARQTDLVSTETLVFVLTLMLVKQLLPKEFFLYWPSLTKLVKFMMELQPWIGWSKNKKEVSQLLLLQHTVFGRHGATISST